VFQDLVIFLKDGRMKPKPETIFTGCYKSVFIYFDVSKAKCYTLADIFCFFLKSLTRYIRGLVVTKHLSFELLGVLLTAEMFVIFVKLSEV